MKHRSRSQKCMVESALVLLCAFAAIVLCPVIVGKSNYGFQACRLSLRLAVLRKQANGAVDSVSGFYDAASATQK